MRDYQVKLAKQRYLTELCEWIGTPYEHRKCEKHIGADCLGLILGARNEAFGSSEYVIPDYFDAQHRFAHSGVDHQALEQVFDVSATTELGDIIVFEYCKGRRLHLAVLCEDKKIIHTNNRYGVQIVAFPQGWHRRILATYELRER